MNVRKRTCEFLHIVSHFKRSQALVLGLVLLDELVQRAAFAELHEDAQTPGVAKPVADERDDVLVLDRQHGLNFVDSKRALLVTSVIKLDHLQTQGLLPPLEIGDAHLKSGPEAAFAQFGGGHDA